MYKELIVTNLTTQKDEIIAGNAEVNASNDEEKILKLIISSTSGIVPDALEVIETNHASKVDLHIECSGDISQAGLIIACGGKPKHRRAHFSTIFRLKDIVEEGKKSKSVDPYSSCLIETLGSLGVRKNDFAHMMGTQSFITAFDAKKLKIIDDAGIIKNKYKITKEKPAEIAVQEVAPQ